MEGKPGPFFELPNELKRALQLIIEISGNSPVRILFDRDTLYARLPDGLDIRIRMQRTSVDDVFGLSPWSVN